MFTGLVEEVGRIHSIRFEGDTALLEIEAQRILEGMEKGDSLAVNGVCLTASRIQPPRFQAELSSETVHRTGFRDARSGTRVNLERALLPSRRLGGHFVQGHVDAVATVLSLRREGKFAFYEFSIPPGLKPYLVEKGSVALDGISLTVARLRDDAFEVALIPHTLAQTTLGNFQVGLRVNLECDILAKYVESLLARREELPEKGKLTLDYLKEQGY
jgi:riboflavin synthase